MRIGLILALLMTLGGCSPPWQGPPDFNSIFVANRVVEWKISVSDENWLKLMVRPEEYVEAELEVDDAVYPLVGLRLMGTKRRNKRNLRIRFNQFDPSERFFGVKRVNLRNNLGDPSQVREGLALDLMRTAGIKAPRFSFVWVTLNGGAGLYTLVQQVDKRFLEDQFGEDRGNLYKLEEGGGLVYQGDDPQAYWPPFERSYELKTNQERNQVGDLIDLMKQLDGDGELDAVLDVERTLQVLAVNSWLSNMDSYPGTTDNLFLYHDAGNRFRWIPWDLNQAFGNYHGGSCTHTTDELLELDPEDPVCDGPRPMVQRLLSGNRERYRQILAELVDGVLHPDEVIRRMESMQTLIRERVHQDTLDEFSAEDFDMAFEQDIPEGNNPVRVPGLVPFVQARDHRVRELLGGN